MKFLKHRVSLALVLATVACGGGGESSSETPQEPQASGLSAQGTVVPNPNTQVMPGTQLVGAYYDGNTLVVRKPQATVYAAGTVLILNGLDGRLIEITQVSETDTEIRYEYTIASLRQAFKEFDVQIAGTLTPRELGTAFETNNPELDLA